MVSRREQERIDRAAAERAALEKELKKKDRTPAGRLTERVREARANVTTAMTAAAQRGPILRQLEQSATDWKTEATRLDGEIRVARQLTGDPQKLALKKLKARLEPLEEVANRIVETAFTDGLTTKSAELDRLQDAAERLEALDRAYEELEGPDLDQARWRKSIDDIRERAHLPERFRK